MGMLLLDRGIRGPNAHTAESLTAYDAWGLFRGSI
jgi:hypothetical protein